MGLCFFKLKGWPWVATKSIVWLRPGWSRISSRLAILMGVDSFEKTVKLSLLNLFACTCDCSNLARAQIRSVPVILALSLVDSFVGSSATSCPLSISYTKRWWRLWLERRLSLVMIYISWLNWSSIFVEVIFCFSYKSIDSGIQSSFSKASAMILRLFCLSWVLINLCWKASLPWCD